MSYCTVTDLVDAFGVDEIASLTTRTDAPPSGVVTAVADKAIVEAVAEVNMYLEGRYPLPLASTPLILTQITADLARFYLHTRIKDEHPVAVRYKQRIKQLEGIATGKLALGLDAANNVATPADTVQIAPGRNDWGRSGY